MEKCKTLILFDVDGTLCHSGQSISKEMIQTLKKIPNSNRELAIIGGGSFQKISLQLKSIQDLFSYICTENGLVSYKGDQLVHEGTLRNQWNDEQLTNIVSCLIGYLSELDDLPIKTGKFIDLRRGLIYYSLIGQDCSFEERQSFKRIDVDGKYRIKVIKELKAKYPILKNLEMSLGGELGISVSPEGWDKSFVSQIIDLDQYEKVYFFGDKMEEWGSDEPMKKLSRVDCIAVASPEDCADKLQKMFNL